MSTPELINSSEHLIQSFFRELYQTWGPQHWWPADTRFEVIAGAFLTQNTAWPNVERALSNLRAAGALSVSAIREIPLLELEQMVRPAGYFRQKALRLKGFVAFLDARYQGSLTRMFVQPTNELRRELLDLNGVGPETADSILLYSGNHPVFVVDAYTRRVVERHGILAGDADYEEIRQLFESALCGLHPEPTASATEPAPDNEQFDLLPGAAHRPSRMSTCQQTSLAQRYNEMHAFFVGIGKRHCFKREPNCQGCPLRGFLQQSAGGSAGKLPKARKA